MLFIGLAGWPYAVRPSALQQAHEVAYSTLRSFGISAGQPLFHMENYDWKQYGYCLVLRGRAADGTLTHLFPPEGKCRFDGVHWRLPPVHRATHRMLSAAWEWAQQGTERTVESDRYLSAITRHFCTRQEPRPVTVEGLWTWYYRHYQTAEIVRRNGLSLAYDCEQATLSQASWHPNDEAVIGFWGPPPWQ
jgi:hypothetical protein